MKKWKPLNIYALYWQIKISIREEKKCGFKAGNSCYYSVQTYLSTSLEEYENCVGLTKNKGNFYFSRNIFIYSWISILSPSK